MVEAAPLVARALHFSGIVHVVSITSRAHLGRTAPPWFICDRFSSSGDETPEALAAPEWLFLEDAHSLLHDTIGDVLRAALRHPGFPHS